jgi:anthranilate phosphoribosyltransferase
MVVHGLDGLDEISTVGKTVIAHLKQGEVTHSEFSPHDFGLKTAQIADLQVSTLEDSAETLFQNLNGKRMGKAKTDIVLVNSAAGIMVGGKADNFKEGIQIAKESIDSGAAYNKLKELVKESGGTAQNLEELEAKHD